MGIMGGMGSMGIMQPTYINPINPIPPMPPINPQSNYCPSVPFSRFQHSAIFKRLRQFCSAGAFPYHSAALERAGKRTPGD